MFSGKRSQIRPSPLAARCEVPMHESRFPTLLGSPCAGEGARQQEGGQEESERHPHVGDGDAVTCREQAGLEG